MDPRFSIDAGGGFYVDPNTGEIFDSGSGQAFSDPGEFEATYGGAADLSGGEESGSSGEAMGQAGGVGGSLLSAYMLQQMLPGAAPAAAAAPTAAATAAPIAAATTAAPSVPGATVAAGEAAATAAAEAASSAAMAGGPGGLANTGMLASSMPWLAPAAVGGIGAYTASRAYDAYKDSQGKGWTGGLKAGIKSAGPLNFVPLLGQAAWLGGMLGGGFGGKKHKDQYARDAVRGGLKESGFFDSPDTYTKTLKSGASLDFGMDGGARLQNAGANIDGRGDRGYYDADFSREDTGDLAALLDPLGTIYGQKKKTGTDMTGYLVNLAQQKGDSWQNAQELYGDLDYQTARELINQADVDQDRKDAMFNTIDDIWGVNAYAGKGTAWERKGLSNKAPRATDSTESPKEESSTQTAQPLKPTTAPQRPPRTLYAAAGMGSNPGRPAPAESSGSPLKPSSQTMFVRRPDPKKSTQAQVSRLFRRVV